MQVVVQGASGEVEVEVAVRQPQATVGDLAVALGAAANGHNPILAIGEQPVHAQLPLAQAGLHQGAVVRLPGAAGGTAASELPPRHGPDLALTITGGAVAGPSWPLVTGNTTNVGRDPANDVVIDHPTVSSRHATVHVSDNGQVTVADLGSRNGTWLDGVAVNESNPVPIGATLRLGAVFISVVRPPVNDGLPDASPRRGAGTVSLNRPPRSAGPREPEPLDAPAAPPSAATNMPLSIVAIIAPLLFAGVMIAATKSMYFALFAVLSPVMAIGAWLESRRRARQTTGAGNRQFARELAEFRAALDGRVRAETERRRKTMPHPAELLRWAYAPTTRLWERRPHHDDFLQLHGGIGTLTWLPTVQGGYGKRPPEVDEALATGGVLPEVPVAVDLAAGRVVGVVGGRPAALALARSLLLQATTLSGPADLQVAIFTDPGRVEDWEWAKWLPHTVDVSRADANRRLACGAEASNAVLQDLLAAGQGGNGARATEPKGPVTLVVLDAESLTEGPNAPARAVLRGEGGPVAGLVVSAARHRLPAMCTTVIELLGTDGNARLNQPEQGEVVEQFVIAGVSKPVALRWARALTRFGDPEVRATEAGLTDVVNLIPLLETDLLDPAAMATRWRRGNQRTLTTPIGVTTEGVLRVDVVADGPHALIVGTSGAGKSELLRTVVAGLASALSPDHVNFLLIDCRASHELDQCARLPHAVGLVSSLDEQVSEQVLRILEAEVRRREGALRAAGATDVNEYLGLTLDPRRKLDSLPRLLIVIDDVEVAAELGKLTGYLVELTQRGGDVGIHLVLAAQRLPGSVGSIKTDLRLVLRTQTEADSINVIGTNVAATVAPGRPGRGFAGFSTGKLVAFQAAQVRSVTAMPATAVEVRPFRFSAQRWGSEDAAGRDGKGSPQTGFARFVTAVDAAFAAGGLPQPRQLWSGDAPVEVPLETVELLSLLGIDDVGTLEAGTFWHPAATPQLRVPIGVTPEGQPLNLDVKESAFGGMGPHGLVVGATGSGKSEFLRTLVGGLAITHAPEQLSFVLVDFKGGATFSGVADLPHVAGVITNLENDLSLVDRMHDALFGEQQRRQELLHAAGGLGSVHDYQQLRATGVDLPPLPSLMIIVDEFAELLAAKPDFIDLFVSIGRLGRSLGMHLLLSSQRLEEGRLRGLESHIRYRVGLRTFSAQDSRAVLGVPDAYELPSEPGVGYLKVDMTTFTRFKGALISMPYTGPDGREPGAGPAAGSRRSVLDVVVRRLADAPRVHQVWLPPLEPVTTLDQLLPGLAVEPQRGLVATGWHGVGRLVVPIGVVDRPAEQRRGLVEIDAAGAGGNLVVVGAPQTGKSTLLRTVVTAFALTHTPAEVQFYCLDYGGGGLATLEGLPHVGSVASRLEPDKVRRLVAEVDGILARREQLFRERGIDSAASLRALRKTGSLPDEQLADVFLVIDNWSALRRTFEDLEESVLDVAARGLGYGIHVIVTVNRWMDIRANLRDSLRGILELRLTETAESAIDRKVAVNVPVGAPGRGLTPEKLHFQTAVPRIDGKTNALDLQAGVEDLVARVASAWSGPTAPPVRLLPAVVNADQLPAPGADHGRGVPVGVVETDLSPLYLDLTGSEPHFLVFGDGESGKTAFLRTFITGLCARHSHKAVRVGIIDYRRTLLETVAPEYLGFYAGAAPAAAEAVAAVRAALIKRLPGSDVSAAQLRARSWWQGPDLYLVVDDYDLVATAANPLSGLLEFVAQGRDLGFHLILARRVAGAQRALFEPVLQQVKELGNPGIILSGDRGEGPLLGTSRATAFPPGRGLLVRRKEQPVRVQVAWTPESERSST